MPSVLITAFEPYDCWEENSSWLTLMELTRNLPSQPQVTTRLYPVNLAAMRERLAADLAANYDYAIHLGQHPGSGRIRLESIAINVGGTMEQTPDEYKPLVPDGPVAFQSPLPLAAWSHKVREAGIPCQVSYHAGTFLCNATLYLSHFIAGQQGLKTQSLFIHLPLEVAQSLRAKKDAPSLPRSTLATALRLLLDELATEEV